MGGEVSDYRAFEPLLKIAPAKPKLFLVDRGYDSDSDHVRQTLLLHGTLPVIPSRKNRKKKILHDRQAYKERNHIERMLNRLKQFRRIATRYDKTAKSFSTFLNIAAIKIWLPTFVNRSYS